MKKITTLFKKDPNDLGRVVNEINPENNWVFDKFSENDLTENGEQKRIRATRKFDGTACMINNYRLYKRYDARIDTVTGQYKKPIPPNAIPCQEADHISGHHPHWIPCSRNNTADQYHFEAFDRIEPPQGDVSPLNGTYELIGPKISHKKGVVNPEGIGAHMLIPHGAVELPITDFSFESIKNYLAQDENDIEGIVFYHPDGRMCKIRKSDFGFKRHPRLINA